MNIRKIELIIKALDDDIKIFLEQSKYVHVHDDGRYHLMLQKNDKEYYAATISLRNELNILLKNELMKPVKKRMVKK